MSLPGSLERLNDAITAVCPLINSISIGDWNVRSSWRIDFKPEATQQQKDAAQSVLNSFDQYDQIAENNYQNDIKINQMDVIMLTITFNHENRIRVLENRPTITLAQFKTAIRLLLN